MIIKKKLENYIWLKKPLGELKRKNIFLFDALRSSSSKIYFATQVILFAIKKTTCFDKFNVNDFDI